MMLRCWEVKNCGQEKPEAEGTCGALDADHAGCWLVAGPDAAPEQRCVEAKQGQDCRKCDYYAYFQEQLKAGKVANPYADAKASSKGAKGFISFDD